MIERSLAGLTALALTALSTLAPRVAEAHELADYDRDVKPIFLESCSGTTCHIGRKSNGVDLTTYETTMASVGSAYKKAVVVPGSPDESPLMDKITNQRPQYGVRMPSAKPALTDAQIQKIRAWIAEGAQVTHLLQRGDMNGDDHLNITDGVYLLDFLFRGGPAPHCETIADANSDGQANLTDAVYVLNHLFLGGEEPVRLTEEEEEACRKAGELSFESIYRKIFVASCAYTSCHSVERHKGGLVLEGIDAAHASLVGVMSTNEVALAEGMLRVSPGKPEESFLLKKLTEVGPGEGSRMPASSSTRLSEGVIAGIREWILAGAPREGTISGVPDITEEILPPVDRIPQPPVPENGIQLHLPPFSVAPRSEREIFYFVDQPLKDLTEDPLIERIDVHMSDDSHHFILYEWKAGTKPAAGIRNLGGVVDVLNTHRFITGAQQSYFSLSFPPGAGIRFSRTTSFDMNSHFLNLGGVEPLMGEVYINIFFAPSGSVTTFVKPVFDINPLIDVPPNQTRTTKWAFPGLSSTQADPAIGSGGKVTRETHIYSLSSHMHRHGTRFTVFLIDQLRDTVPPTIVYDNLDWDDPIYKVFDPPLVLKPGQGFRFETTHTYDDPPSPTAPPLQFGETSEDEMAILLGFYAVK